MSYSRAVQKEIYLSWKPVFSQPRYSQLRKLSKIKEVINLYAPASHRFWHPNLAVILKDLLEGHIFYLDSCARNRFPELFDSSQPEKNTDIASGIGSTMFGLAVQTSLNGDDEHSKELMESLKGLYTSGRYSDLTITCQGKSYRVHRAIVCPRSGFFAAACNGQFKEASEGRIDLPDDDPEAVDAMISYFYRLNYDLNWVDLSQEGEDEAAEPATFEKAPADSTSAPRTRPELVAHAKVYILAEKYLIGGLKALALQKFTTSVCNHLDVDDFLSAIQEVYNSTSENDRGLRDVIVSTLYKHKRLLDLKEVQVVLKDLGAVTYDLVMYMHKKV